MHGTYDLGSARAIGSFFRLRGLRFWYVGGMLSLGLLG